LSAYQVWLCNWALMIDTFEDAACWIIFLLTESLNSQSDCCWRKWSCKWSKNTASLPLERTAIMTYYIFKLILIDRW